MHWISHQLMLLSGTPKIVSTKSTMKVTSIWCFVVAAICFLSAPSYVFAEDYRHGEYQVKAALIYGFAKYIQWPEGYIAEDKKHIIFGILGRDPFGASMDNMVSKRTVGGKRVIIKRFSTIESLEPIHVLFISSSEKPRLAAIIKALKSQSALTIGDMAGFLKGGGMIKFTTLADQVRFEVNLKTAKEMGLVISSQLANLANKVIE